MQPYGFGGTHKVSAEEGAAVKHVRTVFLILVYSVVHRAVGSHTIGTLISSEFRVSC